MRVVAYSQGGREERAGGGGAFVFDIWALLAWCEPEQCLYDKEPFILLPVQDYFSVTSGSTTVSAMRPYTGYGIWTKKLTGYSGIFWGNVKVTWDLWNRYFGIKMQNC